MKNNTKTYDRFDGYTTEGCACEYCLYYQGYDILAERFSVERLDEVVELLLETVCSNRENIRVAGADYPRDIIKRRLLKLNSSHIEYAFDCIDKNTTKVRNIKAYLLTMLYNVPTTTDSYYRAEVNHDMYGGGL